MFKGRFSNPGFGRVVGSIVLTALIVLLLPGAGPVSAQTLDPAVFPVSESLVPNVQFWTDIYSKYTSSQAVVHDEVYLEIVYEVLDLSDLNPGDPPSSAILKARSERFDDARERIARSLRELSAGGQATSELNRHVQQVWSLRPGRLSRYSEAAERVRSQSGLKDRFERAIEISGRYMPALEEALASEGVPVELSRLPFVESMFQSTARSKVGAAGAWQFMPGTARSYLQMNSAVDSRMDPILAAHGAARLLSQNFKTLGGWPLAITAYNHGAGGVGRAVRTLGTVDLGKIATHYQSRTFGFASRNFYSEFVAAFNVYANYRTYFPGVVPEAPLRFDEITFSHYVSLMDLAQNSGLEVGVLRALNPALSTEVFADRLLIPRNYPLRVPSGSRAAVQAAYNAIPDQRKLSGQLERVYRVERGDTLSSLAGRFGTTTRAIQNANNLSSANRIYIGQPLVIPGQAPTSFREATSVASSSTATSAQANPRVHIVQAGESLDRIARRYGTDARTLAALNDITRPDLVVVGKRLRLPGADPGTAGQSSDGAAAVGSGSNVKHVVRRGENLTMIARRYGVTASGLQEYNSLPNSVLQPGQVLRVP